LISLPSAGDIWKILPSPEQALSGIPNRRNGYGELETIFISE